MLESRSSEQALRLLTEPEVRDLWVATGHYRRLLTHTQLAYREAQRETGDQALMAVTAAAIIELSAYCGASLFDVGLTADLVAASRVESWTDDTRLRIGTAMARLYRVAELPEEELVAVSGLKPRLRAQELELDFRRMSALNRAGMMSDVLAVNFVAPSGDLTDTEVMAIASIYGDFAEAEILSCRPRDAIPHLVAQFRASWSVFHSRGMYVSGIRLVEVYLTMGDLDSAAKWFEVLKHFPWIAQSFAGHSRFDMELARSRLRRKLGGSFLGPVMNRQEVAGMMVLDSSD